MNGAEFKIGANDCIKFNLNTAATLPIINLKWRFNVGTVFAKKDQKRRNVIRFNKFVVKEVFVVGSLVS